MLTGPPPKFHENRDILALMYVSADSARPILELVPDTGVPSPLKAVLVMRWR
jgi:hypothetical protein